VAAPAFAGPSQPAAVDVVIVGAGAAGIAAARRLAASGRSFALLEASPRIGGRCITDTAIFGVPFDLGAHWIHMPDINPIAKLAPGTGLDIYPAPSGQRVRIGRRNAREGELEDYLASLVRSSRAIGDAARKADVSCAQALPKDLGVWQRTVEFVLGPFGCAKDLGVVSAVDFARSAERDVDAFCRQGFGALLARLAQGVPVRLSTPVTRIEWGNRVEVETASGRIAARHIIVTASTEVLLSGKIQFSPDIPKRQLDALSRLRLGSYDHVALELKDNPFGLQRDDLVFEQATDTRTAALLANVSGTPLALVEIAGRLGRELSAKGAPAMTEFAVEWLAKLYGGDVKRSLGRAHATRWNAEPWVMGAFSAASPGGQGARRIMMEPLRDRVFFAGEAVHETLWGTVGGAWESGERAAETALRRMGVIKDKPEEPPPRQKRAPKRRSDDR
jgi:monoamine oxidase